MWRLVEVGGFLWTRGDLGGLEVVMRVMWWFGELDVGGGTLREVEWWGVKYVGAVSK